MNKSISRLTISLIAVLFMVSAASFASNETNPLTTEKTALQAPNTNARVRVKVINLLGIEISPCGLDIFFDAKVRVKQPNSGGIVTEVPYSCSADLSDPIYIQPGTVVTGIIIISGTPFSNGGTITVKQSDIDPNGQTILEISVTVDIPLPN